MGWGCWFTRPQPVSGGLCACSQWGWRESREAHAACARYRSGQPQGTGGLSSDHCQLLSTNANLFCPEVAVRCLWRACESVLALLLSPLCPQVLWGRQCWRRVRFLGALRSSEHPAVRTRGGPGWPLSCHPRPRGQGDHWRPYSLRVPPLPQPHPPYPGLSLTLKVEGGGRPLRLER